MKTFTINDNVKKYTFGNPINTDTIAITGEEINKNSIDFFNIKEHKTLKLIYKMNKDDIVFGLGENQRGINKRGYVYESFCTDDPVHTENKKSLYGCHNFIIIDGNKKFGVFVDSPSKVVFDIGFLKQDEIKIDIEDKNADIYIIQGYTAKDITKEFLNIIGDTYVPPKWAFGYQQSRWSYKDHEEVENLADKFIENNIPCDAIYLDIDYMENFKDFTIDKNAFPQFKEFVQRLKHKGFRLIPIIDAGVRIEKGYETYEQGIKNNYFCMDKDGKPFVAAVWPGRCHFPDFLNSDARKWFGLKYKTLTDLGIEGFWNDMNEPAIFYTDRSLSEAVELAKNSEKENLNVYSFFNLKDKFVNMSNNIEDYKSFYHNMDGEIINHYKVHNIFGYNMTKSASEGLKEIAPNNRFLLFSRASYIGMHRFSGIWTGDNCSWWSHLLQNIKMMPSLNMCGFLYIGADTGGFGNDSNSELVTRWTQFSMFTPLFRNHSAKGTRTQEPFAFDDDTKNRIKNAIEMRYSLIPYIYSEYMKAVINKDMYFSPISFEYDDDMSRRVEDQLLLGDSIMLTPVYEENVKGRYVYIPEDMFLWKAKNYNDKNYEVVKKGHMYLNVDIDEIPIFIRKDKMIVKAKPECNIEKINGEELDIIAFVEDKATYVYYDDDGKTYDYKKDRYSNIFIEIKIEDNDLKINIENKGNKLVKKINFEIIDTNGNIRTKTMYLTK
ncbi:TIM-barrel domain-containing protein [Clostridium sp. Marseille-Q2269]|uniref:TIM-barrel domain-containing protein n=1 Tax=Clostridium sp. Marseille-Q2269 TaxID=2942205 RepID=UPI0020734464|nr:TIM-barrel domain-containing protein [Clostridium sp. Marseille-Q2269]